MRWSLRLIVVPAAVVAGRLFLLHLVELLLLVRSEQCPDLLIRALVQIHHLRTAVLLGERTIIAKILALLLLVLQDGEHLGLLIRA